MTPRGTDWTLAALVALLVATGALSLLSGHPDQAWVFEAHGITGAALALVTVWKLRRVWPRIVRPSGWTSTSLPGLLAVLFVGAALLSGWVWSSGGNLYAAGWNLLNWHIALGVVLAVVVWQHLRVRGKPLRMRDVTDRRQFLRLAGVSTASVLGWSLQRPAARALGWRGSERRWTGSYEVGSFRGNAFPETSWVADHPRPLSPSEYRLTVGGLVGRPLSLRLSDLVQGDELRATLDCTGGFYTTQVWRGLGLGRLLDQADVRAPATHVQVVSYTGYRWSFPLEEARGFLLAARVGDEALTHGHGGPVRLVAPGRRGFQWIKWVVRLELTDGPDLGAAASTLWSSLTPEGRGER